MNKKIRIHDPKIVPPPDQRVDVPLEYTKDQIRLFKELARELGYWSIDELFRAATGEFIKGNISIESLRGDPDPPKRSSSQKKNSSP